MNDMANKNDTNASDQYKVLLVDDVRSFLPIVSMGTSSWVSRTTDAALQVLPARDWDEVWLDHDLGADNKGNNLDIWPVVDFLVERAMGGNPIAIGKVFVHTSNPVAAPRMIAALQGAGYKTERVSASDYLVA